MGGGMGGGMPPGLGNGLGGGLGGPGGGMPDLSDLSKLQEKLPPGLGLPPKKK